MSDDDVVRLPWPAQPYTWQQAEWQHLNTQLAEGRLPHGLLVSGAAGIGKIRLVKAFAARLLCTAGGEFACGHCKSCHLLAAGVHPDLMWMTVEVNPKTNKPYTVIRVEQTRELVDFSSKAAQMAGWRVVVIEPAELLNVNAANAMLKTLEEPGSRTIILLVTSQPLSLPATIRSRCQALSLKTPAHTEALAWLKLDVRDEAKASLLLAIADGAPLAAQTLRDSQWFAERGHLLQSLLALAEGKDSALNAAKTWGSLGAEELLLALNSLLADIVVMASGITVVKHQDVAPIMAKIAARVPVAALLRFRQGVGEKQRLLAGNVSGGLVIDALFAEWVMAARG